MESCRGPRRCTIGSCHGARACAQRLELGDVRELGRKSKEEKRGERSTSKMLEMVRLLNSHIAFFDDEIAVCNCDSDIVM